MFNNIPSITFEIAGESLISGKGTWKLNKENDLDFTLELNDKIIYTGCTVENEELIFLAGDPDDYDSVIKYKFMF